MNGAPCAFFDGLLDYFTAHMTEYHATEAGKWNGPCVPPALLRLTTSPANTISAWLDQCRSTNTCSTN